MYLLTGNVRILKDNPFYFLRKAVEEARHPDLKGITIYVAQDCTGEESII